MLRTIRLLPATILFVGIGIASTACAAQTYGSRGGSYPQADRRAYDLGYREGVRDGESDIRRGRDYSYTRHDTYRDADQGYRRNEGDRDQYRRSFRQGYQTGYSEAYNRYAGSSRNNPRGGAYPTYPVGPAYPNYPPAYPNYPNGTAVPRGSVSQAGQIGYRDGLEAGRNAARSRERYDPVRAKRYREGDHDYNNRYGSRDEYKREYRAAFEQGYREGYGRGR
jgi:hypothetical protein